MGFPKFIKDPDAVLDFGVDWSKWLETDETITSSEWLLPMGITSIDDSTDGKKTVVWLSGGTSGQMYTLTNRITTSAGRIDDRSINILVKER